ncbi:MAG: exosortase K [Methylobacter sp.]|uniref:exosortase K n=1 Tax=Methylobacter sp. TaxID=2051955 RepID=UPI002585B4F0|nr:exosortase K [Methylobacter sp.]MCL7423062.1 exosortase K [Methylobacter sp.]
MFNGHLKISNHTAVNGGLTALMVIGIKHYYSVASAGELQWLLYPLVLLLELLSPLSFEPLANGEWLDMRHHIRIVKACAGGNFFIISLLGYLWLLPDRLQPLGRIVSVLLAAWLTTLCANSLRIVLSVYAGDALSDALSLSPEDSHRLIGILSYFLSICLQLSLDRRRDWYTSMVVAALLYLTVTLLMPLLRGWVDGRNTVNLAYLIWITGIPLGLLALAYGVKSGSLVVRAVGLFRKHFLSVSVIVTPENSGTRLMDAPESASKHVNAPARP